MRYSLSLFALYLLCMPVVAQQNGNTDSAALKTINQWVALQSTWGVAASEPVPGSSLELVEKLRQVGPDGRTVIHYNFKVVGLAPDANYTMEYWPVGGSLPFQKVATGLHINKEGIVVCGPQMACGDKKQAEYPLELANRVAIGESVRFLLASEKDHTVWVTGIVIPFPLTATSGGCRVEFIRVTPNGEILLLKGTGFPTNQDITINGNSAGENHSSPAHTDSQGTFQKAELPFVTGKNSGTIEDTIMGGGDCHPSISAKWGEGSRELQ